MTDRQRAQLLRSLLADAHKTREGYITHPNGPYWQKVDAKANRLLADLELVIPKLGPIVQGGLSIMLMAPTHDTDGLLARTGSHYPAFDSEFGQIGRVIIAPESLTVTTDSSAQGGDAFYATGVSGLKHWCGHIDRAPAKGARLRKGQRIGAIAAGPRPHVHWGIDARPLIGRDLRWGRDGDGPDYTFGSPTIGAQLAKGLA